MSDNKITSLTGYNPKSEEVASTDAMPPELLKQLSKSYLAKQTTGGPEHDAIAALLSAEAIGLDDLLVGYWKATRKVMTRGRLRTVLQTLIEAGKAVRGNRGTFTAKAPAAE